MSEPSPEQSFTIHLKSLTDFADEFTTQIQSLQAPMDHLATMSGTPPQYGAFQEAWRLGAGEQAAIEEMFSLLGQVKQAIAFAGDVTGTVAEGYRHADENVAWGLGGPPASNTGNGNGNGPGPWQGIGPGGNENHRNNPYRYSDPTQNNQNQVIAQPLANTSDPTSWTQNTSDPFAGSSVPAGSVVGAVLGGTLLAGAGRSKSHGNGNRNGNSTSSTFDGSGNGPAPSGDDSSLWTPPPPDPGQEASWTATTPTTAQGGTRP
jgi:hypothetical protein